MILLLLVCFVGFYFECVGIFDIGFEGKMLVVVMVVGVFVVFSGNVWVGLLVGVGVFLVMLVLYGLVLIIFCGN